MRYIKWILFISTILEVISIILVTRLIGGGWTLFLMILSVFCGLSMLRNTGIKFRCISYCGRFVSSLLPYC